MKKYVKVMFGNRSGASDFEYKINEVNVANNWNPKAKEPKEMGGYSFSTEDKILRWILRGDTIYNVVIPNDAEVIECENKNTPNGVFRTNKIIIKSPKLLTDHVVMDLYHKSDLPEETYFQCLSFLSLRNYSDVCKQIVRDKVNRYNVERALKVFENFLEIDEKEKTACYKEIYKMLNKIKGENK